MDARRYGLGLLAMAALLAALSGVGGGRSWGIDLSVGRACTHLVLTAASVRLAFNFERDCPESNSMRRGLS